MSEKTQLRNLMNEKLFKEVYTKLIVSNTNFEENEKEFILMSAILFFRVFEKDKRNKNYFKLAYHIILKYSLLFKEYKPLYDISIQVGFYPICKTIIDNELIELNSINEIISEITLENVYKNSREGYVQTLEQYNSTIQLLNSEIKNLAYIAPTSFGKSSIIKDFILTGNYSRIAIIVPTKSLLVQTYNDIRKLKLDYKLILHDEMYDNQEKFIGILTQERATRLLSKNVSFEIVFVDEAHNILKYNSKNYRGLILARLLKLNRAKEPNQKLIYFSPLVNEVKNLTIDNSQELFSSVIKHNLKSEDILLLENHKVEIFDKFTGSYNLIEDNINFYDYIFENSVKKNFIYNFKPVNIEKLAKNIYEKLTEYLNSEKVNKIIETLEKEVHKNFYMNEYLKKGIIYLHAKMPNLIKEYLESKFKEIEELKYIIANKVILEGINLPIDTLFITSTKYLDGKELTNLIGRVNRLNYVFAEKDLNKLNPKIHFLNEPEFQGDYSVRTKIETLRSHTFKDKIQNPLLINYDIDKLYNNKGQLELKRKTAKKNIELISNTIFLIENDFNNLFNKIKKYFIENNFEEFYSDIEQVILDIEHRITIIDKNTWENLKIIEKIVILFIDDFNDNLIDFEIERLKNKSAQNYYTNYIEKIQKQPLNYNINQTYNYFKQKSDSDDPFLFIGETYGEEVRYSTIYNSNSYNSTVYVNLSKYSNSIDKLVNLAIVKLKIEEDFVGFKLNKLITFLHDFNLISENDYNNHVYGTTNKGLIKLARLGLGVNIISKLIKDNQIENVFLDDSDNLISNHLFMDYLSTQSELFKFEIKKYL
jgi:superfamily II DNA or RNA helicase